jgi:hypothetical protein
MKSQDLDGINSVYKRWQGGSSLFSEGRKAHLVKRQYTKGKKVPGSILSWTAKRQWAWAIKSLSMWNESTCCWWLVCKGIVLYLLLVTHVCKGEEMYMCWWWLGCKVKVKVKVNFIFKGEEPSPVGDWSSHMDEEAPHQSGYLTDSVLSGRGRGYRRGGRGRGGRGMGGYPGRDNGEWSCRYPPCFAV